MSVVRFLTGATSPTQLVPSAQVTVPAFDFQSMTAACAEDRAIREAAAEYWRDFPRREMQLIRRFFRLVFIWDSAGLGRLETGLGRMVVFWTIE